MAKDPLDAAGLSVEAESQPASVSKVDAKVELDLDDAPFLDDETLEPEPEAEEKAPESARSAPAAEGSSSTGGKAKPNRKKLFLAGGVALVLLIAGIGVNVFLFPGEQAPPAAPVPEPEKVLAAPKPLPEAATPHHVLQWPPFWVEVKDTEGAVRFLTCKFSIPTDNAILFAEMNAKRLILRDALFYYLRNQPIISLTDEAKSQAFKSDLMTVLNEHLGSGKISEILIEDYLVQ